MRPQQVIKVGGAHLSDPTYLDALTSHLAAIVERQGRVLLVHGGGCEIAELHDALEVPYLHQLGLRVTSEAGMSLVTMVLCGLVNKRLVAHMNNAGLSTLGVCGADLGILNAEYLNYRQLGRVGGPPRVNVAALTALMSQADVLAVSPVCLGPEGGLVNVNADLVAQTIAVALSAHCLDFVTSVTGVHTEDGIAQNLASEQVEQLIRSSVVGGGMIPKLQASLAALDGGVDRVRVGSLESLERGTATEVCA